MHNEHIYVLSNNWYSKNMHTKMLRNLLWYTELRMNEVISLSIAQENMHQTVWKKVNRLEEITIPCHWETPTLDWGRTKDDNIQVRCNWLIYPKYPWRFFFLSFFSIFFFLLYPSLAFSIFKCCVLFGFRAVVNNKINFGRAQFDLSIRQKPAES